MAGIVIDFEATATEESKAVGDFTPLDPGDYAFFIYEAEVEEYGPMAANAGRPCLKLTLKEVETGKQVWNTVPLFARFNNEKQTATFSRTQFVESLGIAVPEEDGKLELPSINDLMGTRIKARVKIRAYTDKNGNAREGNEVERFLKPDAELQVLLTEPVVVPKASTGKVTLPV